MSTAHAPKKDPVQIFCTNFPSHKDLTEFPSAQKTDVAWPKKFETDIQLRVSRYSLEVLSLVSSSKEPTDNVRALAVAVLEFYGPSPIEMFCRPDKIAEALIETNLIDEDEDSLIAEVSASVENWLSLADTASRKMLPELAKFEGKTDYKQTSDGFRWAPLRNVPGIR